MGGVWRLIDRIEAGIERVIDAGRARSRRFDHISRALGRYLDVDAGRLAAATAYYGFFAIFGLAVVTFVILGRVFRNNQTFVQAISDYLQDNLPLGGIDDLIDGSGRIGVIAFGFLVIAGVGWVETLRSSQRAVWKFDQQPGNPVVRWLLDLTVLVGLGILLLISIGIFSGIQDFIAARTGELEGSPVRVALRGSTTLLAGIVDLILGMALLAGVPRLRMSLRRLLPPALLFAFGLGVLKTLGKLYITRTERNPAYQLVAGTVGLLLFMYLLHQLLLFAAALAATDSRGRVVDLAGGPSPPDVVAIARSAERAAAHVEAAAVATEGAAKAAEHAAVAAAEVARPNPPPEVARPGPPEVARPDRPEAARPEAPEPSPAKE